MYTSGRPKNQNICWKRTTSPPAAESKKAVLKFLSSKSIVIPPAKTGRDSNSRIAVIRTDQQNKGILCKFIIEILIFRMVTIKFMAPSIDESPARCKLTIVMSRAGPERAVALDKGG